VLECAEECLGCAFVYVTASRVQSDLPVLVKTFMYLGFHTVAPNVRVLFAFHFENPAFVS